MILRYFIGALLASHATAQAGAAINPQLVGTWTTKTHSVFTGPNFYDPINDKIKEPALTGISYSFTADGHYEEAYYRAGSSPSNPNCPMGTIQWQHGTFMQNANGSLSLSPIAVDGRQQTSNPCSYTQSVYTRYNQPELFAKFEVGTDKFHGVLRLQLYQFDGAPMNPMWLAYQPPLMLPTVTLNPTASSTGGGSQATSTGSSGKQKRSEPQAPLLHPLETSRWVQKIQDTKLMDPNFVWWCGVGATTLGSVAYFLF